MNMCDFSMIYVRIIRLQLPFQITYPLCTIASTPRLPEHCIEYVKMIQWVKENPFDRPIDGDDPLHISWIYEKAQERATTFSKFAFSLL